MWFAQLPGVRKKDLWLIVHSALTIIRIKSDSHIQSAVFNGLLSQQQKAARCCPAGLHSRCPPAQPEAFLNALCWCQVWLAVAQHDEISITDKSKPSGGHWVSVSGLSPPQRGRTAGFRGFSKAGFWGWRGAKWDFGKKQDKATPVGLMMNSDTDLETWSEFEYF